VLIGCSTLPPTLPPTLPTQTATTVVENAVVRQPFDKLEPFIQDMKSGWEKRNSSSPLRIVFRPLDTNTDENLEIIIRREVEKALLATPGISLVERADIKAIFDEESFEASNFFSMSDMKPLRLEIADAVIFGLLEETASGSIRLHLSCIEYETALVLSRQTFDLPSDFAGVSDYRIRVNQPPPAPSVLYTEEGSSSVRLTWEPVKAFDAVYEVLRSDSYDVEPLYRVIGNLASDPRRTSEQTLLDFIDRSVSDDHTYYYRLRYRSRGKESLLSASVLATPFSIPPTPANLAGSWNKNIKAAIITWSPVSRGVNTAASAAVVPPSVYEYEGVSGSRRSTGSTESTVVTLGEYEPDIPLLVRVRAVSSRGVKSEYSPWLTVQVPPAGVSGLRALQMGTKTILSWDYPYKGVNPSFSVFAAIDEVEFKPVATVAVNTFEYSGFSTGSTVRFRVCAVGGSGLEGTNSNTVTLETYTDPPTPVIRQAKAVSTFVLLEWEGQYFRDLRGYTLTVIGPDGRESLVYEGIGLSYTYSTRGPGEYRFMLSSSNTRGMKSDAVDVEVTIPATSF
jgi:hypothetical protein